MDDLAGFNTQIMGPNGFAPENNDCPVSKLAWSGAKDAWHQPTLICRAQTCAADYAAIWPWLDRA
jgi:hypothetical protein